MHTQLCYSAARGTYAFAIVSKRTTHHLDAAAKVICNQPVHAWICVAFSWRRVGRRKGQRGVTLCWWCDV